MGRTIHSPRRAADAEPAVRRRGRAGRTRPRPRGSQRLLSLILALLISGAIAALMLLDVFVVSSAEIGGLRYVPAEEVFADSGVAGQRVLFIDPQVVEERLETSPSLESARVTVQWPARVIIRVREREPALIWEQGGQRYWVDLNGHLMAERRDVPGLLRVVNEGQAIPFQCPGPACADQDAITIDPEVVRGAQHLKTLRANIDFLYYDPVHGLSYQDGRGWRAYFGIGATMDVRLVVYETLVASLESRGIRPVYIDVSNPDAPFYRVAR